MPKPDVKPVGRPEIPARRPRSALRTTVTSAEIKGMRGIRRLGRDAWERLAEAQRIGLARARRRFPRDPRDVQ